MMRREGEAGLAGNNAKKPFSSNLRRPAGTAVRAYMEVANPAAL
jgi:hypothetical protein